MSEAARTPHKRRRVRAYLLEQTTTGAFYTKSRQIATALDGDEELSANEIGQAMLALSESASELAIERWGYTSATTWRVQQVESAATARSHPKAKRIHDQ